MGQRGHQAFRIEHRVVAQHEIDGAGQFDGQHGVGFEFVAAHFGFQSLSQRADGGVIALGNHRRFAKRPAQIGIAQLGPAQGP